MTAKKPVGGFRKHTLAALIQVDPKRASGEILAAYRLAGASLKGAAKVLGCSERTLHRWADQLEIREALGKLTRQAEREGWLTPDRHVPKG